MSASITSSDETAARACSTGTDDLLVRVMEARKTPMITNRRSSVPDAARPQGAPKPPPAWLHSGDMADPLFDAVERAQLSDLFGELGPGAPTLLAP